MSGKIILHLAISLDGFIADEEGGYDWIQSRGDSGLNTSWQYPFETFRSTVDVVVMGHHSYRQGFAADYPDRRIYVAASTPQPAAGNITFIGGDIVTPIAAERDAGRIVYLFGGGIMIDAFIKANVIDEYCIGIIPVLLGRGRPLFLPGGPAIPLRLVRYSIQDGVAELHYVPEAGTSR